MQYNARGRVGSRAQEISRGHRRPVIHRECFLFFFFLFLVGSSELLSFLWSLGMALSEMFIKSLTG